MNILTDPLFPVTRRDGSRALLRFADLTADYDSNPVTAFAAPREDFDGALLQLAIALLQTALAPETHTDWRDRLKDPPTPAELDAALASYRQAFDLDGDGPAFMQDFDLEAEALAIDKLLIDAPGENTIKRGLDFFNKRDTVQQLCPACASAALFCLQTNAPSGGQGHRTGLRGGGPLTTLFEGTTLWETLWLAVFETEAHPTFALAPRPPLAALFPWLAPTRTSEKGETVTPETPGVHGLQTYWAMPRRIRLDPPDPSGDCHLCGATAVPVFHSYRARPYGNNYALWQHPLTPHYVDAKEQILPIHGQPGYYGYQQWLGFLLDEAGKKTINPAKIIRHSLVNRKRQLGKEPRLLVFGYDMDNMKARNWIRRSMPVIFNHEQAEDFSLLIRAMVESANQIAQNTHQAYLAACFEPKRSKGDHDFVKTQFWTDLEPGFLAELERCQAGDFSGATDRWLKHLRHQSSSLFQELLDAQLWTVTDPQRVVEAESNLHKFNKGKNLQALSWPAGALGAAS